VFTVKEGEIMAVLLEKLYSEIGQKYQLRLIAGKDGIFNMVDWVQIVENSNLISFQRENELVISTGVANHDEEELLSFCKQLDNRDISGLIINIGPYIRAVPQKIITYCDQASFPLFVLPWEIRLVDIMHDMGRFILKREQMEDNLSEAIQNAIFSPAEQDVYTKILAKNGFRQETRYSMTALALQSGLKEQLEYYINLITSELTWALNRINPSYIHFKRDRHIYIVAANYSAGEIDLVRQNLGKIKMKYSKQILLNAVVSSSGLAVGSLSDYYGRINTMLDLVISKGLGIVEYEKEVIYKLLLSVQSRGELVDFCQDTYGRLVEYDKANHTDCCSLLKQYFALNGSIQKLANANFVHRNTINYQLRKIEKICNANLENWEDRLKIHLSVFLDDLL
jgi:PucR family transcriptional regulator, proline-responsive transcriptional activator